ncbi:MAG TPA: hypothetical protein VMJ64_12755 [Anaerolineales bacterium]|nr:hypothetical protein [Anaerolineales bacterium]
MQGDGLVSEVLLLDQALCARVQCDAALVPAPGQYLLAVADGSDAPLATVLFAGGIAHDGFLAAPPIPSTWQPGTRLLLRGPLGHGFSIPPSSRRLGLVAFGCLARTLLSLLDSVDREEVSVTLVADHIPEGLPTEVEVQPLAAVVEVSQWTDFLAVDVERSMLPGLRETLQPHRMGIKAEGQALIRTPMPCGALADCGVCTVVLGRRTYLACADGPVFDLRQALEWSSRA